MIEVRPLLASDIPHMLDIIRPADLAEIEEGCGIGIRQALDDGLRMSVEPLLILGNGQPLAAFGEVSLNPGAGIGVPWLISTIHVERHARGFLRACRPLLQRMSERHPYLANQIDARNTVAIRWLQWLGFLVGEPVPHGPHQIPFRPFHLHRGN